MHRCMGKRRTLTWLVVLAMPVLLVSYGWFMNHRPALHVQAEWTLTDALIPNSDLLLSGIFLVLAYAQLFSDVVRTNSCAFLCHLPKR